VRECLAHARLAPHLVVRVNDEAVEAVETLIKRVAQESGFAGRLVVLGQPDIMPGDGRIEWADGGFAIDAQRLSRLVEQAVAAVFGPAVLNGDET
jgi:flagellar assembly protein FliH